MKRPPVEHIPPHKVMSVADAEEILKLHYDLMIYHTNLPGKLASKVMRITSKNTKLEDWKKDILPAWTTKGSSAHYFVVRNDQGRIIGMMSVLENSNKTVADIHNLIVDKSARGTGAGGALMETAINFFKEKGFLHIQLDVAVDNATINFYEKYGFINYPATKYLFSKQNMEKPNGVLTEIKGKRPNDVTAALSELVRERTDLQNKTRTNYDDYFFKGWKLFRYIDNNTGEENYVVCYTHEEGKIKGIMLHAITGKFDAKKLKQILGVFISQYGERFWSEFWAWNNSQEKAADAAHLEKYFAFMVRHL